MEFRSLSKRSHDWGQILPSNTYSRNMSRDLLQENYTPSDSIGSIASLHRMFCVTLSGSRLRPLFYADLNLKLLKFQTSTTTLASVCLPKTFEMHLPKQEVGKKIGSEHNHR